MLIPIPEASPCQQHQSIPLSERQVSSAKNYRIRRVFDESSLPSRLASANFDGDILPCQTQGTRLDCSEEVDSTALPMAMPLVDGYAERTARHTHTHSDQRVLSTKG